MPITYAMRIGVSNPNVPIFPPRVCTLVLFINPRCGCAAPLFTSSVTFVSVLYQVLYHVFRLDGYSSCRVCMYVCVCVCVTTHNCHLTHWNHKTEIPTCSQQYSNRFKFGRFS